MAISNNTTALQSILAQAQALPDAKEIEPARSVVYSSNGTAQILPASGYDGLEAVNVTINVSGSMGQVTEFSVEPDDAFYPIFPQIVEKSHLVLTLKNPDQADLITYGLPYVISICSMTGAPTDDVVTVIDGMGVVYSEKNTSGQIDINFSTGEINLHNYMLALDYNSGWPMEYIGFTW